LARFRASNTPCGRWNAWPNGEEEKLRQLETDLAAYKREVEKPFEHEARLKELELKQAELKALDLHKSDPQAIVLSDEGGLQERSTT